MLGLYLTVFILVLTQAAGFEVEPGKPEKPSWTAESTAAMRAIAAREPDDFRIGENRAELEGPVEPYPCGHDGINRLNGIWHKYSREAKWGFCKGLDDLALTTLGRIVKLY